MLELLALHHHLDFVDDAVKLLEKQWPRSESLRSELIKKSNDSFRPMCYVLVVHDSHLVVGYVKVTAEFRAVFLESFVIDEQYRGKGFGRQMMTLLEEKVRQHGFDRINLTTIDKAAFYTRLGFEMKSYDQRQAKVNEELLAKQQMAPLEEELASDGVHGSSTSTASPAEKPKAGVPAPPPPPPNEEKAALKKVFMFKVLPNCTQKDIGGLDGADFGDNCRNNT